ncbi:MAG: hypothetical protein ACREJ0_17385, partial [Geminicoccaceae bacterium]
REPNATADCPGDMWRLWPWGATHDAEWEPYNGALFGGIGVGGNVLFAGNTVRNAYNGIRLYPSRACRQGTKCLEQTQRNVSVIGNTFAFVRDNPIEPELHAADWHIAHNRFFNNHAWISTDGVAGGPVYVYGNVGWFSREIPGLACVDGPHWRDSLRFLFEGKREGRYVLTRDVKRDYDPLCGTHRRGTVVKLGGAHGDPGPVLDAFYIFHNSWLLRSPIFAGGYLGSVGHWNNAVLLAGCGRDGAEWCRTRPAIEENDCPAKLPTYAADDGASLVADCFAFADGAERTSSFDHDVGYPDLRAALISFAGPTAEAEGRSVDPMFGDPWNGGFWPRPGSPLIGNACLVAWDGDALVCRPAAGDRRANVGAIQPDGRPFALPPRPSGDQG